ncbi:MAG: OmpA family protein [Pseudomonadota bacterium]|nr:OmpA family protein [Pseudomonadota bacterium]
MKMLWSPRVSSCAAASFMAVFALGCAGPETAPSQTPAPAASAAVPAAAAPVPPATASLVAAPFAESVSRAGERLLQDAQKAVGTGPRELVIDPLIDASTGQQTAGTVQMGTQLAAMVKTRAPQWNVRPLSRTSLGNGPLLLIGTLTAINTRNVATDNADAFRVCLVLIDLRTGKLIAKRVDRATAASVDAEPTPFYRDSPTWALDKTAVAYVKSCQGSSPGDAIDPRYLLRLPAAALINEAQIAFADHKPVDAYRLFREAQSIADPEDLRVLNGLYLSSWRTGKKREAADTFGKIVGVGLNAKRLPIKIFFNPGSTTLLQSADLRSQYAVWIHEVALQVALRDNCMKVTGHTSRTGDAAANDVLSQKRAGVIKASLEKQNRKLAARVTADGVGSRETIVGLGTDDLRDALDRRVEFRTVDCS